MSNSDQTVPEARDALSDAVLGLRQLVQAFEGLAGEDCPPWLFTFAKSTDAVHEAAERYMGAVHESLSKPLTP